MRRRRKVPIPWLFVALLFLVLASTAGAAKKRSSKLDSQYRETKRECESAVSTGTFGDTSCRESFASRENCVLRCTSEKCYQKVYGDDPLEEGEIDSGRSRDFRICARTDIRERSKAEEL
mmetsp:Transcript_9702/g.35536  ORF Transcript_9702/g.35536 Transcript_9702/m.35536 type:complete len:120 (-) Transcript_9702:411-770(-)